MAGKFIRKLMGRPPATSPEVEAALTELDRLGRERPSLADSIALLTDILPGLYREPIREQPPVLTREEASIKLAGRIPLLRGETFLLSSTTLHRRWRRVCAAVRRHQEGEAATALADACRRGRLDLNALAQEALAGRPETIHARADALGLDAGLTATVLRLTLFPVLARANEVLLPLRAGFPWGQGYCPTCGSWPLLGEYRGLEQTRFLRCGLCAGAWEFPRLQCPFCGTRDHHMLGYFSVDGEEARYRAATCACCHGYVKMAATLAALTGPQLLVADLATMHLDLAAAERGYSGNP